MEGRESLLCVEHQGSGHRSWGMWGHGIKQHWDKTSQAGKFGIMQWAVGSTEVLASGAWLNGVVFEEGSS